MGRCREGPSLAQHHRAPDRGAGRLGARRRAGAVQKPDAARRHGLGRDRRHGLLGGRREPGPDPWRRRQPQRQQVHRQQPDLSPGRRATTRSASSSPAIIPTSRAARPRRRSRRGRSSSRCCARATASRSTTSMRTTGSTTRTPAIAKAAARDAGAGVGGIGLADRVPRRGASGALYPSPRAGEGRKRRMRDCLRMTM